jgi:hypothetical protein
MAKRNLYNPDSDPDLKDDVNNVPESDEDIIDDGHEELDEDQESDDQEELDDQDEQEEKPKKPKERTYTKEQVTKIVQTRVNGMKNKLDKYDEYKSILEDMSDITGISIQELSHKIKNMGAEQQATILGVCVEEAVKLIEAKKVQRKATKTQNSAERKLEEIELKSSKKYSDYDLYKEEIETLVEENPKLTLKQAYILTKGDLGLDTEEMEIEQRARAKRVQQSQKKIVRGESGTQKISKGKISSDVMMKAKKVGMDPLEYQSMSEIKNLDDYLNYKNRNKKGR